MVWLRGQRKLFLHLKLIDSVKDDICKASEIKKDGISKYDSAISTVVNSDSYIVDKLRRTAYKAKFGTEKGYGIALNAAKNDTIRTKFEDYYDKKHKK